MNTDPYPGVPDVMAELAKLADLHAAADQAHAEAAKQAQNRRPATPFPDVEEADVDG